MSSSKRSIKLFFVIFTLVLAFGVIASIALRLYNEKKSPEKFNEGTELNQENYHNFPRIDNLPTRNVTLGSNFTYAPKIVPIDSSVKLSLLDSPEWLNLDGFLLSGVPSEVGTAKLVLRLEKDGKYIDEEFFLVVTEALNE
jgi:hypothetical protein